MFHLLLLVLAACSVAGQNKHSEWYAQQHQRNSEAVTGEQDVIMFWRPQKVGSSTLLSILMGYAFRMRRFPRTKARGSNLFCRKIAKCALENFNAVVRDMPIEYSVFEKYVNDYLAGKVMGAGTKGRYLSMAQANKAIKKQEAMRFHMSIQHEICNMPTEITQNAIRCAFAQNGTQSQPGVVPKDVKQLFLVREPISRALSVYYFWGMLFDQQVNGKPFPLKRAHREGLATIASTPHDKAERIHGREELEEFTDMNGVGPGPGRRRKGRAGARGRGGVTGKGIQGVDRPGRSFHEAAQRTPNRRALGKIQGSAEVRKYLDPNKSKHAGFSKKTHPDAIMNNIFVYHGNQTTAPPLDIAMAYAAKLPYREGMPGPSKMWSTVADSREGAVRLVASQELFTLVLERLDESLIAARHYLGWSIADVVHAKSRKAQSSHPKASEWPAAAIGALKTALEDRGEMAVYQAANTALDVRLAALRAKGVDVDSEISHLREVRERVRVLCFEPVRLDRYKRFLESTGLPMHRKGEVNNHKDVEEEYKSHCFSLNTAMFYSFDVCGGCEATAIELSLSSGRTQSVAQAESLDQLPWELARGHEALLRCPHPNNHDVPNMRGY